MYLMPSFAKLRHGPRNFSLQGGGDSNFVSESTEHFYARA